MALKSSGRIEVWDQQLWDLTRCFCNVIDEFMLFCALRHAGFQGDAFEHLEKEVAQGRIVAVLQLAHARTLSCL